LETAELTLKEVAQTNAEEETSRSVDFIDAHKLLSVIAGLED